MTKWKFDTFATIPTFITSIITYFNTLCDCSYPADTTLDDDFYINKLVSMYMSPIAEYYDETLNDDTSKINKIVTLFESKFYDKYKIMFKIFKQDYNPIENYDMTEREDSITTTGSMYSNAGNNKIFAYNSSNATDTDETASSGRTDGGETLGRDLTRHGNIGVTTTQQMIDSTVDVYDRFNIVKFIYKDYLDLLTLDII